MISGTESEAVNTELEAKNLKPLEQVSSTHVSEASIDGEEDEFKRKETSKYEYINENVENWPQWSVEQKPVEEQEVTEDVFQLLYNRGLDYALRTKLKTNLFKKAAEIKEERKEIVEAEGAQKFDIKKEINKRMKGWRTW